MPITDPVAKQFVNLDLTGGINKKQDLHQLQNGQLLTADNVIFGAVEGQVTKRYGCVSINPQGAALQGGPFKAIGIRDGIEPLVLGANTLNKYNVAQNLSTSMSTPTQGRLDVSQVVGSTGQTTFPWPPSDASCATDGTQYVCLTWQEPNATGALCFYGVQDLASGTWIIPPSVLPNLATPGGITYVAMMSPTVKYYNGNFYLFYLYSGTSTSGSTTTYSLFVFYNILPITNLAFGMTLGNTVFAISGTNSVNSITSPNPYGYDVHMSGGKWILAAGPSNNDNQSFDVSFGTVAANGNLTVSQKTTKVSPTVASFQRCSVRCDGPAATPYLVAFSNTLTIYTSAYVGTSYTMYTDWAGGLLCGDCCWLANGNAVWLGNHVVNGSYAQVAAVQVNPSTGTLTKVGNLATLNTYFMQMLSRVFTISQNGKVYAWVGVAAPSSDTVYNSAFLYEFDFNLGTSMIVCRTLYLKNAHITNTDMMVPCDVVKVAGTSKYVTFISSALEKTSAIDYHAFGALNRVQFDFAPARSTQLLALPQGGVLGAGAYPFYYDGNSIVEAGFSSTPTADKISQTSVPNYNTTPTVASASNGPLGGASAVTPSGSIEYYYVICLVRRDAYGNVYRSAPSPVITVPCPNAQQQVTFPAFTYNGGGNVMFEFYRSTQNITGTYYFLRQVPNSTAFIDTFQDGSTAPASNNSITKNRTVYTNANELPNDPPPPIHHAAVSETRVYIIPSDARNTIWFSKLFSAGRTVEFTANNVLTEGNNTALFTAIHILDSYVIVFKADQVLYFYGNGPDNTGSGSFSTFQRITTDVGCIDPASVVITPGGILFRSRRGIELLNRSLQVTYIGGPIEPLLSAIPVFASTVVVPQFMQVRFVPQAAGQPVLVYDYGKGRWSTFSNMAAVNAHSILGNYWWISQDGTKVYQETTIPTTARPNIYTDDGAPIVMTLETPEIPVGAGGAQGWGRAYRMALLGDFYTSHTLQISFAYDHANTYTDTTTFNTTSGLISGDAVYQFRCSRLPRQVMQTLRLKITESGTIGQSCAISNIALEVGSKNGLAKLPAQKTV